jgi:hypothetical protein
MNTPEALAIVEAARNSLAGLNRFFGRNIFGESRDTFGEIRYEHPNIVEDMYYFLCGASSLKDGIELRREGDRMKVRDGPDSRWQDLPDYESEDVAFFIFREKVRDPREVLSCLQDVSVGLFGENQKVLRAILRVRDLNPPAGLIEDIRQELATARIRRQHFDVDTWTKMQRPGNMEPAVEFYLDLENRPLRMTIGRILPGDEDSFTIEFTYE